MAALTLRDNACLFPFTMVVALSNGIALSRGAPDRDGAGIFPRFGRQ